MAVKYMVLIHVVCWSRSSVKDGTMYIRILHEDKDFYVVHSIWFYCRSPVIDSYEPLHVIHGGYWLIFCYVHGDDVQSTLHRITHAMIQYVTGFGKTLRMGFFQKIEFDAWLTRSSLRPIARFVVEIQCFVCDRATPPIIEKLRSKGVAMHAEGVSAYYA